MKWPVASLSLALLFALVSATSAQQAPPLKSSIEGVVVQSRNGEPIEGCFSVANWGRGRHQEKGPWTPQVRLL